MEVLPGYTLGQVLEAFWTTIQLTVYSAIGALILGTVLAAMRLAPVPVLNWIGTTYVNVVRNTPLTLIILFCSFGLAQTLGITLVDSQSLTSIEDSNFRLAVLGLTVYTAAFVCETVRSGVNTVPLGQAEAARSLGLTFGQNLRMILLPQAFRAVILPLGSVLIALTKNTTIASAIGVAEAALLMKEMIENTAALMAVGTIFLGGFLILTLPMGLLFGWLGKRLAVGDELDVGALRRARPAGAGTQPRDHRDHRCAHPARALGGLLAARGEGPARRGEVEAVPHREPVEDLHPAGCAGHVDRGRGVDRAGALAGLRPGGGTAVDSHRDPMVVLGGGGVLPRRARADHDDLRVFPVRVLRRVSVEASGAGGCHHGSDAVQRRRHRRDRPRRRQRAARRDSRRRRPRWA